MASVGSPGKISLRVSLLVFDSAGAHWTISIAAMLEFAMAQSNWYASWPQNPDDRAFRMYVFIFFALEGD
jgi:hypothetical protein